MEQGKEQAKWSLSALPLPIPPKTQPKPPDLKSKDERLPHIKFRCTLNLFSNKFVLISNDIHVTTCAQTEIGNTLQDKATNIVAKPYASQLIDNLLGEAINQS